MFITKYAKISGILAVRLYRVIMIDLYGRLLWWKWILKFTSKLFKTAQPAWKNIVLFQYQNLVYLCSSVMTLTHMLFLQFICQTSHLFLICNHDSITLQFTLSLLYYMSGPKSATSSLSLSLSPEHLPPQSWFCSPRQRPARTTAPTAGTRCGTLRTGSAGRRCLCHLWLPCWEQFKNIHLVFLNFQLNFICMALQSKLGKTFSINATHTIVTWKEE